MSEIKISTISLDDVIAKIEVCHNEINDILTDAKTKIESLDVETWSSPKKTRIDTEVNPYIATFEQIYKDLQEYTKYLHMVVEAHIAEDTMITNAVEASGVALGDTLVNPESSESEVGD